MSNPDISRPVTLSPLVKQQAIEWLLELQSETVTDDTRSNWQRWRQAHPEHELAWQKVEAFGDRMNTLQPSLARAALTAKDSLERRRAVKMVAILLFAGTAALSVEQILPWRTWRADHVTRAGEIRTVTLDDGSQLALNTRSTVKVEFSGKERRIRLMSGEIMISTAHENVTDATPYRPFLVETSDGELQALGTRFTVHKTEAERSSVAVYEGAVEVRPALGGTRVVSAGSALEFSTRDIGPLSVAPAHAAAWTRGMLVVEDMPLSDFVAELARYRSGWLNCDDAIGQLKVTGTYPLADTDKVLLMLTRVFPVDIAYLTRYWVTVRPRGNGA